MCKNCKLVIYRRFDLQLLIGLFLLSCGSSVMADPAVGAGHRRLNRLCAALENIQPGDRLPVSFSGILDRYNHFIDPREPLCRREVNPATLTEFARDVGRLADLEGELMKELRLLLEKDYRAYVRIEGELIGPERGSPPQPSINIFADYTSRVPKGYQHYRTKLFVHHISMVQPIPEGPVWETSGLASSPFPQVIKAEMPTNYPPMAWGADLSGEVRVQLTIENGTVVSTEVISGDRLLIDDTLASIKTWQFEAGATARFTTTFVYKLEPIPADATPLAVRADLPLRVEIVAPLDSR